MRSADRRPLARRLRLDERAREGALGLLLELLLVIADEPRAEKERDHGDGERGDPDRLRIGLEGAPEQ